ncbi:MAG: TetR/AcrR family transcriptional regulator [Spirochaetaceae bacterium]|nr:TetR/AcrR family transcriptional regulator [Spirochaetaceae bacterium]MDT8297166.1 TetR/AcrR family transcriptional regulator [Spirochaetaceae bacterium]
MKPNDTKQQLEIQALHFFAEHDFDRSSLNDIAKALGVTKGAIYHYFKGKDDLFESAMNRLLDEMEKWFFHALPRDLPFKLLLENLFTMDVALAELAESSQLGHAVTEYKNTMYLVLAALKKFPNLRTKIDEIYSGFRRILVSVMNTAIEKGEIREDTDTEAVAFEITAFYEGALLLGAFSERKDYEVLGPRVCRAIWKGIAAEPRSRTKGDNV